MERIYMQLEQQCYDSLLAEGKEIMDLARGESPEDSLVTDSYF